jgi:ubiquinone/menaquinone biosynthesis C-methylase UbiE
MREWPHGTLPRMAFQDIAYRKQTEHLDSELNDEKRIAIHETWFRKDTANYWRHVRMYEAVDLVDTEPENRWLTVGDGRFGLDAIQLTERGVREVLPTDISDTLLKNSCKQGFIQKYSVQNAENLTFDDESFDFVFCKESYHHFPRPALALYEMLRVARKAVVLIEPNDPDRVLLRRIKHAVRNVVKGSSHADASFYEESGNYIYSVSRREMEKVALGLDLPALAIKGLNDHYIEGCEAEEAVWSNSVYRRIRLKCAMKDFVAKTFLYDYNLLMVVLFKEAPGERTVSRFRDRKWKVVQLPRNPYVANPNRVSNV